MIIGIAGYAQVGKDTLSEHLHSYLGTPIIQQAFADALKEELRPFCLERYNLDPLAPEDKVRLRELLVFHGAMMRSIDPDYWLNKLTPVWDNYPERHFVVSDCRYVNELQAVLRRGGQWVYIDAFERGLRPANPEEERSFNEIFEAVESGDLTPPVVLPNHDTLVSFQDQCADLTNRLAKACGVAV